MDTQPPPSPLPLSLPLSLLHLFKRDSSARTFFFLVVALSLLLLFNLLAPFQSSLLQRLSRSYDASGLSHQNDLDCDFAAGRWVWDESFRDEAYADDCPFIDAGFQCHPNGRNDSGYLYWRWQPNGCNLPRFNASEMLERSRNRRIIFAGDSIGRNQWESLICMLAKAVPNRDESAIYEKYGNPITRHRGFLVMVFRDYNLSVEFYRTPFLAAVSRPPHAAPPYVRGVICLDIPYWQSKRWIGADVLVLSADHWWSHRKTIKSGLYFQVGKSLNMTMDVKEAFGRALTTLKMWILNHLDLQKSFVFFVNHSPLHFSNGTWEDGGTCSKFTEPENDLSVVQRTEEPWSNRFVADVVEGLKMKGRRVKLLNITHLTEFRREAHPSKHRDVGVPPDAAEDCSHWCLPGVPDTWNRILYAHLLFMNYDTRKKF